MRACIRLTFPLMILLGLSFMLGACAARVTQTMQPPAPPTAPAGLATPALTASATALLPASVTPPTAIAPSSAAPTPAGPAPTPGPSRLGIFFRSGQTFITWPERSDLNGEVYTLYRSAAPVTAANLAQAQKLVETGKYSARFYASRRHSDAGVWGNRFLERLIINKGQHPLPEGTGLLVWTLGPEDFNGQTSGTGYYAITVTPAGGAEQFVPDFTAGPVAEAVQDPDPVEISYTPNIHPGPGGHFYIQFMDLRHWNATFHAPNSTNQFLGYDPKDPNLAHALAYAYDYSVFEPSPEMCGGKVPDRLPVTVSLHGWRDNRYDTPYTYDNPACAYGVYPVDETETWYFGFARQHDFRKGGAIAAGDVIENYTEQRVLRMIADLLRKPPGPAVDPQRIYVYGQSMGGTGALAFAERYPNVFAAAYAGQPVTNYLTSGPPDSGFPANVAMKWGAAALNLPVALSAPNHWAAPLQKYNGVGVWDWQNYQASLVPAGQPGGIPGRAADNMAPFGIDHGSRDLVIPFNTQAQPLYPLLNASGRVWGGGIIDAEHTWTNFGWFPPTLAKINGVPFWNLRVIRDESVPGLSFLSSNDPNPPTGPTAYNQTIHWSASWAAWDGPPLDQPGEWRMSFCAVKAGSQQCGTGQAQTVDITPRRLQKFVVTPGAQYDWENRQVSDNRVVARGSVTASADGLLTVKGFAVSPAGNRLDIRPHQP